MVDDSSAAHKFVTVAEKLKIAEVDNKVETQNVTDTITEIFSSMSITHWDDITVQQLILCMADLVLTCFYKRI